MRVQASEPAACDDGRWHDATEVVVVGGGGCGLTAAVAAARGGAEVRVLEKMPRVQGNTGRSGGMIPAAGTRWQRAAGIEESAEDFAEDVWRKNGRSSDLRTTLLLCRTSRTLVEWLVDEVGIELAFVDDFTYPGHSTCRMHAPPSRTGAALIADLHEAAERETKVTIELDCPTLGLIADDGGAVRGVRIRRDGEEIRLRAERVLLACNGFAGNRDMVRRYCPEVADALYFGGAGNTGEGIEWGRSLGGAVAFMDAYQAHASVATEAPILITYSIIMEGGVQVNTAGERFGDETSGYSEHALTVLEQPGGAVWDLYDERLHRLGRSFDDYRRALRSGIVHRADDLASLAGSIGVDADALRSTLDDYHAGIEGGDPFGRRRSARLEPPYYAVRVTGALFHTQGGLIVDEHARVLTADGAPIPNLYAGGGVAAGISGHGPGGYLSGNGLLTALGYGLLAGRHAAATLRMGD